jgi:triacylglycerol lipase
MFRWIMMINVLGCFAWGDFANGKGTSDRPVLADDVEVTRSVPYVRRGKKQILADIYRPSNASGPLPVILMVHGGAWFSGDKVHVTLHARYAARAGFAVVAINYRLAPQHKFPAQLEDCQAAMQWIAENAEGYGFDLDRVAAYGYSAGAHLVCLLGTTLNEPQIVGRRRALPELRAIVAGGSPCEFGWIPEESERLAFWLGASRAKRPDLYRTASPIDHVDAGDPPMFFFHGSDDRIVPLSSPKLMIERLAAHGVTTDLHVSDDAGHIQAFVREEPRRLAISFLNSRLCVRGRTAD